ncbi:hypothetical protein KKC1_31660 [Calderihabitans maritimus]|uniref:Uncharacterized protein n=1 Tax=Calderihabitans maritimus TaxID=1246530 RepID=A0A1Z5HXF3_9FIRM|nr:hypothetical protein KKC1_31660 [Calderihabitans maritimus]
MRISSTPIPLSSGAATWRNSTRFSFPGSLTGSCPTLV